MKNIFHRIICTICVLYYNEIFLNFNFKSTEIIKISFISFILKKDLFIEFITKLKNSLY